MKPFLLALACGLWPTLLSAQDPCAVQALTPDPVAQQGLRMESPDGKRFLLNAKDANGVGQIYVGDLSTSTVTACISCAQQIGGPRPDRFKWQAQWHPSGLWITVSVERDTYNVSPFLGWNRDYIIGELQSGLWTNMWAVTPDGLRWVRLTDFKSDTVGTGDGFTGPAMTPDGKHGVWSQIMDGNIFAYYPFGRWELTMADWASRNGIPYWTNIRNITPAGLRWNEPGNFHPNGVDLVLTGSPQTFWGDEGMDQYVLNTDTRQLTNLTKSLAIWDEHGIFSPDGKKILFMSSYPYRTEPNTGTTLGIKTEFLLMNRDGTGLQQLTHFLASGYPETSNGIAANGLWRRDGRGLSLLQLRFPNTPSWDLVFQGACGR